jgi:hypothetical protein
MSRRSRLASVLRRPGTALLLAVLLLLVLGVVTDLTAPDRASRARTSGATRLPPEVPLARADAVCPLAEAGDTDGGVASRVTVAAPGAAGADGRGSARLETLDGQRLGDPTGVPGSMSGAPADSEPVVARGTGAAAPGLAAGVVTRSTVDAARGLLGTTCVAPASDFWFVGSGALVGQRGRVYLTNPEAAPAVVDLTLYGPDGPLSSPAGRGIAVDSGAQQVRLLDALAPGTAVFAVHVHARTGRVAAAVRDQQVQGLTPRGADWVPATAPPARHQVVAGVVAGAGERRLQVVAPGESDAIVKLQLVTESGSFAPSGLDVLEVKAGSVADVDLADYADGEAVGVALDSDVPVAAAVLVRAEGVGPLSDVAWTSASGALLPATPGVLPVVRAGPATSTSLLLAAPHGDATVTVAPLPPATGSPADVRVPGGSQVVVDLGTVTTAEEAAVSISPARGSGPVVAVGAVSESEAKGPLLTLLPVEPGRYTVSVPDVEADLSTGLHGAGD